MCRGSQESPPMKMTVKIKTLFFLISVIVVVSFVYTYESTRTEKRIIRKEIIKRAEAITSMATKHGELPILSGSPRLLRDVVTFLKTMSDIASVTFYDSGMKVLIHDGPSRSEPAPPLSMKVPVTISEESDSFVFYAPIFAVRMPADADILHETDSTKTVREHIGWVRLVFSKSSMRGAEKKIVERGVLLMLLFTVGSSVFLYFLIGLALRPLSRIVHVANGIADGDFSQNVDTRRHDEIGTLANAFQRMKSTIQQVLHETDRLVLAVKEGRLESRGNAEPFSGEWRNLVNGVNLLTDAFAKGAMELQDAKNSLEKRVAERTAELARANRELLAEIAERKQVEKALKASEERFRRLAENARDAIYRMSLPDGFYEYMSPAATELFGYAPEEFYRSPRLIHQIIRTDWHGYFEEQWSRLLQGDMPPTYEFPIVHKSGDLRWVNQRNIMIRDDTGRVIAIEGIVTDITERKKYEEELGKLNEALEQRVREAVDELRQKDKMLIIQSRQAVMGEMLSNIAHQWRQPLNMLGLLAQELQLTQKKEGLSEELVEANIKRTLEIIFQMSKTIDDFRYFFKPDTERVAFRVSDTVEKALSLLDGSFKVHGIRTEVAQTGDPVINGFPSAFIQVLLNILINARDALAAGQVGSPVIGIALSTQGGKTVVSIADNAGGIPEEIIDKIFEPYFTTKGPEHGTGIGLFMSKTIIEKNMNGTLTARNVGDGAEFRIEV